MQSDRDTPQLDDDRLSRARHGEGDDGDPDEDDGVPPYVETRSPRWFCRRVGPRSRGVGRGSLRAGGGACIGMRVPVVRDPGDRQGHDEDREEPRDTGEDEDRPDREDEHEAGADDRPDEVAYAHAPAECRHRLREMGRGHHLGDDGLPGKIPHVGDRGEEHEGDRVDEQRARCVPEERRDDACDDDDRRGGR